MAALKVACDLGKTFDEWSQKSKIERFRKIDVQACEDRLIELNAIIKLNK